MDATGGLVAKPDKCCPAVMNHVIVLSVKSNEKNDESILYPIAELITCDQTSLNIEIFLRSVISKISSLTTVYKNIADYIVVDWSFAEFNAIIKSQLMSFDEYLDKLYDISETNDKSKINSFTLIASCSSHFTKVVVKDVRLNYGTKKTQNIVIDLIMETMNCTEFQELDDYLRNLLVLLKKKHIDEEFVNCCQGMLNQFDGKEARKETETLDVDEEKYRELYKSSKFYKKYENIYQKISESKAGEENPYHNEKFATVLLKKFLAFLPFFAGPFMNLEFFKSRANNGSIERYFALEKKENRARNNCVLTPEKIGRYVEHLRESNFIRQTRIEHKILTKRLTAKQQVSNIDISKDNWKGKSTSKYLCQNYSRKALEEIKK